ncbi:MAG: hypothetical protein OEM22_01580 [Acidimicrobiia bacterium]|nr:hypothetical protein [Acidimicrobiia bacterium]MDH3425337.1 hypothetical protein [Acidimicrobiia bacterium]
MALAARFLIALLALTLVGAACSEDAPPVEFGEGEVPPAFPDDFPIPEGAQIGTTLIDRVNTRSEFIMTVAAVVSDMAQFFSVELVSDGYVIDSSEGSVADWSIEFSRGDLAGSIRILLLGQGLVSATAEINDA